MKAEIKNRSAYVQDLLGQWDEVFNELFHENEGWENGYNYWGQLVETTLLGIALENTEEPTDQLIFNVREAMITWNRLGLIEPTFFQTLEAHKKAKWFQEKDSQLFLDIGERFQIPRQVLRKAIPEICAIEERMRKNYSGEMRNFLRECGEMLIDHYQRQLLSPNLSKEAARHIAAQLANSITNFSLPDWSPEAEAFCEKFGINPETLTEIAENLSVRYERLDEDINLLWNNFCDGCDPVKDGRCIKELLKNDIQAVCPLHPDVSNRKARSFAAEIEA